MPDTRPFSVETAAAVAVSVLIALVYLAIPVLAGGLVGAAVGRGCRGAAVGGFIGFPLALLAGLLALWTGSLAPPTIVLVSSVPVSLFAAFILLLRWLKPRSP